ncbi:hypothetical protein ACFX5U_12535 [Sphingobacterium sp. SG20118]|uniref:hypothetical protein n=1 Tax=Sphingobacterium sp. SG20118 TaxID=3367156 RepID=UPI0037DFC1AA
MTFLEIIKNEITNVPIKYEGSFIKLVKQKIDIFGKVVNALNQEDIEDIENFNLQEFKKQNKILRNGIIKTIWAYYDGKPSEALMLLEDTLKDCKIDQYLNMNNNLSQNSNLYRIRTRQGSFPFLKKEMFHIPFEKRNIVSTQRFSLPGLPSLYLANSIYVAWEELKRPDYNQIQATRLKNQRDLCLMDLTTDIYRDNSCRNVDHLRINVNELMNKVMIWPLIAACSIKVQHFSDPFKPEYIIPQLLMQWIKKDTNVDGIKYSSTNINPLFKHNAHLYNVVVPVKSTQQDSGLCQYLIDLFYSTQTLPFQLKQFVTQSDHFNSQGSCHATVNNEVNQIELIKDSPEYYFKTIFGMMEHMLQGLNEDSVAEVKEIFPNAKRVRQRSF